jgi:hypothetical protein
MEIFVFVARVSSPTGMSSGPSSIQSRSDLPLWPSSRIIRTVTVATRAVAVTLPSRLAGAVSRAALADALTGLAGTGLAFCALTPLAGLTTLASLAIHAVPTVVHVGRVGSELCQGCLQFRHMNGLYFELAGIPKSSRICKRSFIDGSVLGHGSSPIASARTAGWP